MSRFTPAARAVFAVLAVSTLNLPAMAAEDRAATAHNIADKFSSAMDKKPADTAAPKADPATAEAERIRRDAEAAQLEERMKSEKAEILERARLEATERQAEDDRRKADADAASAAGEANRTATAEKAAFEERARQAAEAANEQETARLKDEARRAMEAEREAEAERLSEKLRKVRKAREAAQKPSGPVTAVPEVRMSLGAAPASLGEPPSFIPSTGEANDQRVTVLLVMEPGDRGIRRFEKTADPILCSGNTCFVGTGSDRPAKAMPLAKALGAGNTLGKRAWSCRHSLTCIFREIEFDGPSVPIQPVDLRILRHDRRAVSAVSVDKTCGVFAGQLACGKTVSAAGYRAWIVPEAIAREVGPQRLEAALAAGLKDARAASLRTAD